MELDQSPIIYRYDGSFAGFLCCVFTAIEQRQYPQKILPADDPQISLLSERTILTDEQKAIRVYQSIEKRMSRQAKSFVEQAFASALVDKEWLLLDFFRQGYRYGGRVLNRLTDSTVATLVDAVKGIQNEIHKYKMFVRFADYGGILAAEIEPKNDVLFWLVEHFSNRLPNERFFIYDQVHHKALLYQPYQAKILPMEKFIFAELSQTEQDYQALWQTFYHSIAIESRRDEKARQHHMPKRYWNHLVEMKKTTG